MVVEQDDLPQHLAFGPGVQRPVLRETVAINNEHEIREIVCRLSQGTEQKAGTRVVVDPSSARVCSAEAFSLHVG